MLAVYFDRARGKFPPCSGVHEVIFDLARPCVSYVLTMLDRARGVFQQCSRYVSTLLEVYSDLARSIIHSCSRIVSTVSRYVSTVLEVCLDCARGMIRPCSRYVFPHCSWYVSTVLEVYFDRARGKFPPCSTVLEVYFKCARVIVRLCSRYVLTEFEVIFNRNCPKSLRRAMREKLPLFRNSLHNDQDFLDTVCRLEARGRILDFFPDCSD